MGLTLLHQHSHIRPVCPHCLASLLAYAFCLPQLCPQVSPGSAWQIGVGFLSCAYCISVLCRAMLIETAFDIDENQSPKSLFCGAEPRVSCIWPLRHLELLHWGILEKGSTTGPCPHRGGPSPRDSRPAVLNVWVRIPFTRYPTYQIFA